MDDTTALNGAEDTTTGTLNATLLANDSDLDGDAISITHIDGVALTGGVQAIAVTNGTVNIDALDNITFTADANYNGPVSFDYTISDGALSDTATVSGTITPVNDAPDAVDDVMNTSQDTPVSLNVTTNDTDVDGDTLTVTEINGSAITAGGAAVAVANGNVSLAGDGVTLTFTPTGGYTGAIAFNYTVSDGALTDTANVTGTVSSTGGSSTPDENIPDEIFNPDFGVDENPPPSTGSSSDPDKLVAEGAVVDAVDGANSLGTISGLSASGAVVEAVGDVSTLGSVGSLSADGAVLDAVAQANGGRVTETERVVDSITIDINPFDVAGVEGFSISFKLTELGGNNDGAESLFPLRIGIPEAETRDQLIVKSLLRDSVIFVAVDYTINSDPNLRADQIIVRQINGDPLPAWLRVNDEGKLVSGVPPVGINSVELRIEVKLSNDTVIIRYVDLNVSTGEIAALDRSNDEMIAGHSLFESQIEKEAVKFQNSSDDLAKSLLN